MQVWSSESAIKVRATTLRKNYGSSRCGLQQADREREKENGAPPDLSRFRGYGFHISKVVRLHARKNSQSRARSMGQQCR
eukprot:scaffold11810_cov126-Skeletonema_dohrnii-CCMP3373.AAC.1